MTERTHEQRFIAFWQLLDIRNKTPVTKIDLKEVFSEWKSTGVIARKLATRVSAGSRLYKQRWTVYNLRMRDGFLAQLALTSYPSLVTLGSNTALP